VRLFLKRRRRGEEGEAGLHCDILSIGSLLGFFEGS